MSCPQSYVIELVDQQDSYSVNFNDTRRLINATDASGPVAVTIVPETAVIPLWGFRNVTVTAADIHGNEAFCHFQVAVQPSSCVAWSLESPVNGIVNCLPTEEGNGYRCLATCNAGFRFTNGEQAKTFSCKRGEQWTPSNIIPDCVPEGMFFVIFYLYFYMFSETFCYVVIKKQLYEYVFACFLVNFLM